jgi:hypothetical protein
MKKIVVLAAVLALVSGVAYANFCARDYVPAATLLVPYAVVTMAGNVPDPAGYTTLLAVTNVSSAKQIIHIVVWDAMSNHIVDFDEVLSGYDVWTINFRDLLTGSFNLFDTGDSEKPFKDNGSGTKPLAVPPWPQIGDFWNGTLGTAAVPYGPTSNSYTTALPQPQDIDYPTPANTSCFFPYGSLPGVGAAVVAALQAAIEPLGQDLTTDGCKSGTVASPPYLSNLTANPLFFYATVDVVTACNQNFPDDPAYWTPVLFPTANNVIIGDIIYLDAAHTFSESVPAVSIEADFDWASATHHGFYSRYSSLDPPLVNDFHEPLATAFGFRYYNSGGVSSNVMVWKNQLDIVTVGGVDYANACLPYVYYAFDENENSKARGGGGPSGFNTAEPNILPYETQKVPLDVTTWNALMANNGWMMLVFDPSIPFHGPFTPDTGVQAWVGVQYYFAGYSTALEAATLGNVWCFTADVLPNLNSYVGIANGILNAAPTAP